MIPKTMLRLATSCLLVISLFCLITYTVQAAETTAPFLFTIDSSELYQGDKLVSDTILPPQIINGRTMLPFRYIVQDLLGGEVGWDSETRTITAKVHGHSFVMVIDQEEILVDGQSLSFGQAPIVEGGRTLLPLRAFEIVAVLDWNAELRQVSVSLMPEGIVRSEGNFRRDAEGLVEVRLDKGKAYVSFDIEQWEKLYDIYKIAVSKELGILEGEYEIMVKNESGVSDAFISKMPIKLEKSKLYTYEEPIIFLLFADGSVDWLPIEPYASSAMARETIYTYGTLPWLKSIKCFDEKQSDQGLEIILAIDDQGKEYDLHTYVQHAFFCDSYWTWSEDIIGPDYFIEFKLFDNGAVFLDRGWVEGEVQHFSGFYVIDPEAQTLEFSFYKDGGNAPDVEEEIIAIYAYDFLEGGYLDLQHVFGNRLTKAVKTVNFTIAPLVFSSSLGHYAESLFQRSVYDIANELRENFPEYTRGMIFNLIYELKHIPGDGLGYGIWFGRFALDGNTTPTDLFLISMRSGNVYHYAPLTERFGLISEAMG